MRRYTIARKIMTAVTLCTLAAGVSGAVTAPAHAAGATVPGQATASPGPARPGDGGYGSARPGDSGYGPARPGGGGRSATRVLGPTCIGASCTGRDPVATRCHRDARTHSTYYRPGGGPRLRIRYSSRCHTAWVLQGAGIPGLRAAIQIRNGATYVVRSSRHRTTHTAMVYSSLPYRACAELRSGRWLCTDWM